MMDPDPSFNWVASAQFAQWLCNNQLQTRASTSRSRKAGRKAAFVWPTRSDRVTKQAQFAATF